LRTGEAEESKKSFCLLVFPLPKRGKKQKQKQKQKNVVADTTVLYV